MVIRPSFTEKRKEIENKRESYREAYHQREPAWLKTTQLAAVVWWGCIDG
jgi:hypothetical protein